MSLQNEIHSKYKFSSSGVILVTAGVAMATFKMKDIMIEKKPEEKRLIEIHSDNNLIEMSLSSLGQAKHYLERKEQSLFLNTVGFKIEKDSEADLTEQKMENQIHLYLIL